MDPLTVATTAISLTKSAGEIGAKVHQVWKEAKDRQTKQMLDGILDSLTLLKYSASKLEDENQALKREMHELRQKLQLIGEVERAHDFIYLKGETVPSCPRCFDVDRRLVHIVETRDPKTGIHPFCPECKTHFGVFPPGLRGRT